MIELYYWPTPNGRKITIFLEEAGLPYRLRPVDITRGEQFRPQFLALNPNNRVPVLVDPAGPGGALTLFESGAILLYLAEKTGAFLPSDPASRHRVTAWLFWQMAGLGPMAGQASHFTNYAPAGNDYAKQRYQGEFNRLLGVMDRALTHSPYLAGDYSIADMAAFPWVLPYRRLGQTLDEFPALHRWYRELQERPAVRRGIDVGRELIRDFSLADGNARAMMFGQTAARVAERESSTADAEGSK